MAGAKWEDGKLGLNDGTVFALPISQLTWTKREIVRRGSKTVNLPVYLNGDRADVLFAADLEGGGVSQAEVAQRGVCLTAL